MTTRKDFLTATAVLAAAPRIAQAATTAPKTTAAEKPIPTLNFDLAAFNARVDRKAPHKHLFAARELDGGPFSAVRATLRAYASIDVEPAEIAPAAVLYHFAIGYAFDDYAWQTYLLPFIEARRKHDAGFASDIDTKTKGNPALKRQGGEWDSSIEALVADANLPIFVCNNALDGLSEGISKQSRRHPAEVYQDLCAHTVANVTIVPAGVWAVHYLQERKYTLLQTS
jgi:hypothetical protein